MSAAAKVRVGILAVDVRAARACAAEQRLRETEWFYVDDQWRLQGLRGATVWLYGLPSTRPDYEPVMEMARAMDCLVIKAPRATKPARRRA